MNKKVSILSVGRSGSKALQLYISTGIAHKFGKVWVSYEPFMYRDKSLTKNPYGRYVDKKTPVVGYEKNDVDKDFEKFVREVSSEHPSTSKFIRAGGRSGKIIRKLNVDMVILIVRDIYEVVESIARRTWNPQVDWSKLCFESKDDYSFLKNYLTPHTNKIVQSAIHWYIINDQMISSLKFTDCNVRLVRYKSIKNKLDDICCSLDLPTPPSGLAKRLLRGNRIHSRVPIRTVSISEGRTNHILRRFPDTVWEYLPSLAPRTAGSLCVLNLGSSAESAAPECDDEIAKINMKIKRNSLFDSLASRIDDKISSTPYIEECI